MGEGKGAGTLRVDSSGVGDMGEGEDAVKVGSDGLQTR